MKLNARDIVWTEKNYHIMVTNQCATTGGCWCPAEAVSFLRFIGINVVYSDNYETGYAAAGCFWIPTLKPLPMSPFIQGAYQAFKNLPATSIYKNKLEKN